MSIDASGLKSHFDVGAEYNEVYPGYYPEVSVRFYKDNLTISADSPYNGKPEQQIFLTYAQLNTLCNNLEKELLRRANEKLKEVHSK
jgi:hypothetical protein